MTELEAVLDEKERTDIPPRPGPAIWNGDLDLDALNQTTQERIDKIQGKLMAKKDNIAKHKSTLNSIFLVFYAIGSVTVLIGSALNTIMSAKRELEEKAKSDGSESKENEEKESGHAEAGTS